MACFVFLLTFSAHASQTFPGYFHIINGATNEVLQCVVKKDSSIVLSVGGHVGTPNQEWEIQGGTNDSYKIINRAYRLVLSSDLSHLENGTELYASKDEGWQDFQMWQISELQPNRFTIRNNTSGRCMEIPHLVERRTGHLQQWDFYWGQHQLWAVQPIPERFEGIHFVENEKIKVGIDTDHGGAICWISEIGSERNVVNTKDLGRYIQQAYYAGNKLDRRAEGQSENWRNFPWNPLQAGDYFGNRSLVMDLSIEENRAYVKTRPLLWDMNGEYADATIETWIELDGAEIIYHGKLNRFVGDDKWGVKESFQELPACYLSSDLKHFYSYTGSDIWNYYLNSIPNKKIWEDWLTHESWVACVDDSLWGFSVYFPGVATFSGGLYQGGDSMDTTAYISPRLDVTLEPFDEFEYRCYFNIGPLNEMMHRVYLRRDKNQVIAKSMQHE